MRESEPPDGFPALARRGWDQGWEALVLTVSGAVKGAARCRPPAQRMPWGAKPLHAEVKGKSSWPVWKLWYSVRESKGAQPVMMLAPWGGGWNLWLLLTLRVKPRLC